MPFMDAEILSIGTELLVGSILNTNARFLSQQLARHGINVYRQTTVGDNVSRIAAALEEAFTRADLVITSGGLGPTEDDVTVEAAARFLGRQLVVHDPTRRSIQRRLKERRYAMTRMIARQCRVPRGAHVLPNRVGTAPGILCRFALGQKTRWLLLLPGPPRELEPMLTASALPQLLRRSRIRPGHFVIRSLKIAGHPEAQIAQKIRPYLRRRPPLTLGIYARPGEVELKIMSKAATKRQALSRAAWLEARLRRRLGGDVFGADSETLPEVAGRLLRRLRLRLAIAESCTGGVLSGLVTDVSGSSDYFLGGVVSYHDRVKSGVLGVPARTLSREGAVSSRTARAMAAGVRRLLGADVGIALTGIAGPSGATASKPVGLVYIALALDRTVRCRAYRFFGSRAEIRSRAAGTALNWLRLELLEKV